MNLDLTVNFIPFDLGERVDRVKFAEAKLTKLGVIGKAVALAAPWAPIYWAASPAVSCFYNPSRKRESFGLMLAGRTDEVFTSMNERALSVYFYCWKGVIQVVKLAALRRKGQNVDIAVEWFARAAVHNLGRPVLDTPHFRLWQQEDRELVAGKHDLMVTWARGAWRTWR